ncbi:MAG: efflux RND transporter periplasmic adaptor subunit [Bacteroidales bacterium]|jgi:membrane fusion protein (multidrug efflux system)
MKKKKKNRLIITILLIIVASAIVFYPKLKPVFASKAEGPGGPGMAAGGGGRQLLNVSGYLISPVQMSDLYNATGTLKPDETVELAFETSGKIVGINFTEGTRVRKGDLLAKINDRPLQAQLEKLQAQRKLVEEKEFRQRSLLDRDAISQESYDQIVTELQTLQADINLVLARIAETELRAPFDGIIGLRYVSEGSYTNPSTKIARLVKIKPIKIEFSIPERYVNQIEIGYPLSFQMDGSNTVYNGKVYAIDPQVDIATRTIVLRALYPNNNEELKPGRFTSVTLLLSQINDAISVPTEAVTSEMEGEMVYVYRDGRAEMLNVNVGLRTESQVQITEGLKFGDTLITSGILQLRQGLPVVLDTLIKNQ